MSSMVVGAFDRVVLGGDHRPFVHEPPLLADADHDQDRDNMPLLNHEPKGIERKYKGRGKAENEKDDAGK